jgi:filamentous hemagglutinin family protein
MVKAISISPLFQISICTLGSLYLSSDISLAQVISDGTVNTQVNTQVTPNGNVAEITGGQTRGGNLFHSFRDFSVSTGNEAFFNNATDISNIFSRVTGGNISNIDGLIRSNGSANLFLINPAGILFGENARLDVGGSFYGSTADSVLFEDGEFSATDLNNPPVLTINAPIGLGFRDNPGDIVNRSVSENPNGETNVTDGPVGLQVPNGETLAIVGGNVLLDDGNLTAKGGHIEIGSVRGAGKIGFTEIDTKFVLDYSSINSFGDITLQDTAVVDVTASGGGSINVAAQNLSLNNSLIRSGIVSDSNSPDAQAGDIRIKTTDSLVLSNLSQIRNSTAGLGNSGNVFVEAQNQISLDNGLIVTEVSDEGEGGIGDAGNINLTTASLFLKNGSGLLADVENQGNAGSIKIDASNSILLEGEGRSFANPNNIVPSQISATTDPIELDVSGESGVIDINTSSLNLKDGGFIRTSSLGLGNAGDVTIEANNISVDGFNEDGASSFIASDVKLKEAEGNGGDVEIITNNLSVTNGAEISVSTFGKGNAGNLSIFANNANNANNVEVNGGDNGLFTGLFAQVGAEATGKGGNIFIGSEQSPVKQLSVTNGALVSVDTFGEGDAGNLSIFADNVAISKQGDSSSTGLVAQVGSEAIGQGGNIFIGSEQSPVKNLSITDDARISVSTFSESSKGNAGSLTITTEKLVLESGGELQAISFKNGNAGNLTINASESVKVIGTAPDGQSPSGIFASAFDGTGNGGNLTIATDKLIVQDKGTIAVGNFQIVFDQTTELPPGSGVPGNLTIEANSITLNNGARIDAATQSAQSEIGKSGVINLQVAEDITLQGNSFISAQAFNNADGGNLNIDARFIIAYPSNGSGNDLVAAADGKGGTIDLHDAAVFGLEISRNAINDKGEFNLNNKNDIDASGGDPSLDGTININNSINPVQGATQLPTNIVEAEQTTEQACEASRETVAKNALIVRGKGGIPAPPDQPLTSQNLIINGETTSASAIPEPIETSQGKIHLARGIKFTKDGQVILTPYATNNAGERIPVIKRNCI